MILQLKNVTRSFTDRPVVDDVGFSLEKGEIGCLLGHSGCGKTTLLRIIAGFEPVDEGEVILHGNTVSSGEKQLPPEKRRIGMVFQDYALFPHLTLGSNVAFGLGHMDKAERERRVGELLELVGLSDSSDKYPHEISGGQQQRTALARALAPRPELLLLDEPFSNLDVTLREHLSVEVRNILKAHGTTAMMVTHNQNEAFAMADVAGMIDRGRLLQWDTPHNLYHRPQTRAVADFVGEGTLIHGSVVGKSEVETALGTLSGDFSYPCSDGCPADVLIRPEDIVLHKGSALKARVIQKNFRGPTILYTLELPSEERVQSLVSSQHEYSVGEYMGIKAEMDDIILFRK